MIPIVFMVLFVQLGSTENNGMGLTPTMGFMSWERFRCQTDCVNFPNECINENLFMTMADAMVTFGLKDAGYTYLAIDDCWLMKNRSADGHLVADPDRFPSGIKALADYMHERGLKLGIYEDVGSITCDGYPGSEGYEDTDAQLFASWGVDMLKFDGCNIDLEGLRAGYKKMAKSLVDTGRDILYVCEWPYYDANVSYAEVNLYCNQYRNFHDMDDCWDAHGIFQKIMYYAANQDKFAKYSGPGHFVDPDQLMVGNPGTSFGHQKIQMAMWCMWSAPLIVSSDLRSINEAELSLLLNRYLIRINQDPLGQMAKQVMSEANGATQVWLKELGDHTFGEYAICTFHAKSDDQTILLYFSLKSLGIDQPPKGFGFLLTDAFTGNTLVSVPIFWQTQIKVYVAAFDAIVWIVQQKKIGSSAVPEKVIYRRSH